MCVVVTFKHINNINCFNIANRAKAIRESIKNSNPNEPLSEEMKLKRRSQKISTLNQEDNL